MTAKKCFRIIHLWLGLGAGLVVFVVSITGCLYAFRDELFPLVHRQAALVTPPAGAVRLPYSQLLQAAQLRAGKDTISVAGIYGSPYRAVEFDVNVYDEAAAKKGWTLHAGWVRGEKFFVNPYTAEVTGSLNMQLEFFGIIRGIHQHLYLQHELGSLIVGGSCIVFLVLLITGLVLWWPANKAAARQRFWFRWKRSTGLKRKNYDLHNIPGFYMFLFGVFFVLTGLVWSFDWYEKAVYRLLGSSGAAFVHPEKPAVTDAPASPAPADLAVNDVWNKGYRLDRMVVLKDKKTQGYRIVVLYEPAHFSFWSHSDQFFYDGRTGGQFADRLQQHKELGTKWRNSNYDLHTGRTLGLPGAILAFVASFIIAMLPLTGFIIWWGRRKKSKTGGLPAVSKPATSVGASVLRG